MADKKDEEVLTEEGKKELEERLRYLEDVARPENLEALKLARLQGDLSENADYDAAKNKQAEIESEINEINHKLNTFKVFKKDESSHAAQLESLVTYKNINTGAIKTVKLVGPTETNLSDSTLFKIASNCPLGKALEGHFEKDIVLVEGPRSYKIQIIKIS